MQEHSDHTPPIAEKAAVSREALCQAMLQILPEQSVLYKEADLRPYETDSLLFHKCLPLVVVLPDSIEQVQAVMRYADKKGVPVVARGAGTGISGGSIPHEHGILLSLTKFKQVLEIDPLNRSIRVQPGATNLSISEAVEHLGLYYAPDPSSQLACSIGGNVAENSGGVHCFKYGLTGQHILQLKVVTADGELVTIGAESLDAAGYDLLALMTGSEGMLGILVEMTLRLLPKPSKVRVLLAAFKDIAQSGQAVSDIIASGIIPAGLEIIDDYALEAVTQFIELDYPEGTGAILLCEADGNEAEVDEHAAALEQVLIKSGAFSVQVATTDEECALFWRVRKAAFPALGQIMPDVYVLDGTVPRKQLANALTKIREREKHYGLRTANMFHAGDGNLHPCILYDANIPGDLEKAEAFGSEIQHICLELGGTITGEHGVGVEKVDEMCEQFDTTELRQFHAVKYAFDPKGILNPGKAVPSLHRCAELGRMHVHKGQDSHPELERF